MRQSDPQLMMLLLRPWRASAPSAGQIYNTPRDSTPVWGRVVNVTTSVESPSPHLACAEGLPNARRRLHAAHARAHKELPMRSTLRMCWPAMPLRCGASSRSTDQRGPAWTTSSITKSHRLYGLGKKKSELNDPSSSRGAGRSVPRPGAGARGPGVRS